MKRGLDFNKQASLAILLVAIFEIFLLMNFSVANSYEIHQSDLGKENKIGTSSDEKIKGFLIGLFSIKQIGLVSAGLIDTYFGEVYNGEYKQYYNQFYVEDEGDACCESMVNGAVCQNVPSSSTDCSSSTLPTKCENTDSCRIGCCYDSNEGVCYPNSPKALCEENGGEWSDDSECSKSECSEGCCSVGELNYYVTNQRCSYLSLLSGLSTVNFNSGMNTVSCFRNQSVQSIGACISLLNTCTFGTEAECYESEGEFYKSYLCSNPALENKTSCTRQNYTGCYEGKDEIYWFDSCGNRENIYFSDRDASWNNGTVLSKEESCNSDSGNVGSESCGNCNYELSSQCATGNANKILDGEQICQSLSCLDERGQIRQNGESWCIYDGIIGGGKDVVGSRHWRRICIEGNITIEPCADYRQEVCAESTQINDAGQNVSAATCRTNRWKNCIGINDLMGTDEEGLQTNVGEAQSKCSQDSDCYWKEVIIGDRTDHYCLPQYPPGVGDEDLCGIATQSCIYVEDCNGCVANCDCIEAIHTERMNEFCSSLGDCGGYVNIAGVYTDGGYTISEAPKVGEGWISKIKGYIAPLKGQFCSVGTAADYASTNWNRNKNQGEFEEDEGSGNTYMWTTIGLGIASVVTTIASLIIGGALLLILGWLIFLALILFLILWLIDCPVSSTEVVFTCLPWTVPTSGQSCQSCNNDTLKPCSQYKCSSLGAACVLENENSENPICLEDNPGDVTPPIISFGEINNTLYRVTDIEGGVNITKANGECVDEFTFVAFTLNTDEYATCKVDYNITNSYDEMTNYLGGTNLYLMNHLGIYEMINVDYLAGLLNNDKINESVKSEIIEKIREMNLYIRCQDTHGNYNEEEYKISFCVKNGPDTTAPVITASDPAQGSYIAYGQTEVNASIWIIEPAECKYSYNANVSYEEMENTLDCDTGVLNATIYGWECKTTINLSEEDNETNVYIKCKDQPWLEDSAYAYLLEEGRARNTNSEDMIYKLYKSKSTLSVYDLYPKGEITIGEEPTTVSLTAKTSGGAKGNGYSVCRYNFQNKNWSGEVYSTGTDEHTQKGMKLEAGTYSVEVTCKDVAGNTAQNETTFTIKLDDDTPKVTRVYRSGSSVIVNTNEEARCAYSDSTCLFNFDNETSMDNGYSMSHSTSWKSGSTYYIKCKDIWGNSKSDCTIQIAPEVLS